MIWEDLLLPSSWCRLTNCPLLRFQCQLLNTAAPRWLHCLATRFYYRPRHVVKRQLGLYTRLVWFLFGRRDSRLAGLALCVVRTRPST